MKCIKSLLYIRTDIMNEELTAGGSVAHTLGVIEGLIDQGIAVVCASSCMITLLRQYDFVSLSVLKNPPFFKWLRWRLNCIISNIFFSFQLFNVLKKHPVDVLYQRYSILNCTGIIVRFFKKIPLILEYNGSEVWIDDHWAKKKKFRLRLLVVLIEKINLLYADFIVVVSDPLKEELLARGVPLKRILVNPNGVATKKFDPATLENSREKIRKNLGIENTFVIGFIGTFSPWHGIPTLQDIIPALIMQNPKVHFLLVGDGPLLSPFIEHLKMRGVLKNHVTCVGMVPQDQGREYLAACDAFVCPTQPNADGTQFFGSPTKLFEYMSMAKPVIASDLGQISRVLKPAVMFREGKDLSAHDITDECGFLAQPGNAFQFVNALNGVINSSCAVREKIGMNARRACIDHYSWNAHAQRIVQFVEGGAYE